MKGKATSKLSCVKKVQTHFIRATHLRSSHTKNKSLCVICSTHNHRLFECSRFQNLSLSEWFKSVKCYRLCLGLVSVNGVVRNVTAITVPYICGMSSPSILMGASMVNIVHQRVSYHARALIAPASVSLQSNFRIALIFRCIALILRFLALIMSFQLP